MFLKLAKDPQMIK